MKKSQISSFMKIRPVGAELFHADRRTDMTKLTITFRNFANAPTSDGLVSFIHCASNQWLSKWSREVSTGPQKLRCLNKLLQIQNTVKGFLIPYTLRTTEFLFPLQAQQGLRMRQMSLKSDRDSVGAYLCHCVTVRLVGMIEIHIIECNI